MKSKAMMLPLLALAVQAIITISSSTSLAIPAFARKEDVNCMVCHSAVPKLNRTGFEYRAAGYRMPDKIGVDTTTKDLGQMMSARASVAASRTDANTGTNGANIGTNTFTSTGGSIYALAGSWGTNFGSLVEFGLSSKTVKGTTGTALSGTTYPATSAPSISVGNAMIRGAFGTEEAHWNFRAGQMHVNEGFGAQDSSLASSQTITPIAPLTGLAAGVSNKWPGAAKLAPGGVPNTPGFELGYSLHDWEFALASLDGLEYDGIDQSLHAVGNGFSARDKTDPLFNDRDIFFRFNKFFGERSSVGGYYYQGAVSLPTVTDPAKTSAYASTFTVDRYTRTGLYGTYGVNDSLTLMLGYLLGTDSTSNVLGADVSTSGGFLAADLFHSETAACGVRFDMGNPSNDSGYAQSQQDIYWTKFWKSGAYVKIDYAHTETGAGTVATPNLGISGKLTATAYYMF